MEKGGRLLLEVPVVQGYVYRNDYDDSERNGTVCQIVARAEPDPTLDLMPKFVVEFGNGERVEILGECLNPWFPE